MLTKLCGVTRPQWVHTCVVSNDRLHDDVIKWKQFPRYWPFVRRIHRSQWIPAQRPVTRSFDVFFDLRLNKWLSKQPWGWWFETPSWSLWRQCNGNLVIPVGCSVGSYYDHTMDKCRPCASGTYQDEEASVVCKVCPHRQIGVGIEGARNTSGCDGKSAFCGIH